MSVTVVGYSWMFLGSFSLVLVLLDNFVFKQEWLTLEINEMAVQRTSSPERTETRTSRMKGRWI
jgi:hypothetical protein